MAVEFDDDSAAPAGNGSVVFDDEQPSYGEDVLHNAGKEIAAIPGSLPGMAKAALGVASAPMDAIKAIPQMVGGTKLADTDIAQDVDPIIQGNKSTLNTIEHPVDSFRKAPISTVGTLTGLLGAVGEMMPENVARATVPPDGPGGVPPETPPPAAPIPPEAPKSLPIVEPGAKTGDPHALFAYNDKFGPDGADRSIYNIFGDPNHPSMAGHGWGSSVPQEDIEKMGIPIIGRQPNSAAYEPIQKTPPVIPMGGKEPPLQPPSRMPPDPNAPPPKPPPGDPLKDIKDWMASKGQKFAQKPGIVQKIGNYLDEESAKLGGKDLGLQLGQVKSMGPGFEGLEKGKALISYAREKGYLDPSLSDASRKNMIEANMEKSGQQLGALRDIADKRGAPPVAAMRDQLKAQLEDKFGIDAPGEVNKVLAKFDKAAQTPTFSKMAKLATDLHAEATPATKMGLHPGPTTEGANILARMNNDATRATFNTEEGKMFTDSLRDFGAHKKLEQAVSAGMRKALVGRGAPGSTTNRLIQEGLDRGGYRLGGNIANKVAGWTRANPKATLPQFFEELAHQSDQSVDDAIQGMSKGGIVPNDVKQWVSTRV